MQLVNECYHKVKKDYLKFLKSFFIPISFWIEEKYKKKGGTLFLGLSGAQGSGKTTISEILKIIIKKLFKRKIQIISIDNFYKTLKERKEMSSKIHNLLRTRGVPGTHDINLLKKTLFNLNKKNFKIFRSPRFDKSIDDRVKKKYWDIIKNKPEIIILEGWCVGAKPQSQNKIKKTVNNLEKNEDKNFIWRKYANEKLKKEYKSLFSIIDNFIFIKIPNYRMVFKWRFIQEKKLRKKSHSNKKIMNSKEIKRFIMFYQRIALQMIKDLSKSASVVMYLKKNHEINKILIR